jgi:glycerol-3-phosphate dehydrogenase
VLCLVGGKWTTFRAFGEQTAERALALLKMPRKVRTEERRIGGGDGFPTDEAGLERFIAEIARTMAVSPARAKHAIDHYGTSAAAVLMFCRSTPDVALPGSCYTENELRYLIRTEFARTLADLLQRRTSLAITGQLSSAAIGQAADIFAEELGWSEQHRAAEEAAFRARLARDHGLTESILTERDRTPGSLECA